MDKERLLRQRAYSANYYKKNKAAILASTKREKMERYTLSYCPKCEKQHKYKWWYTGTQKIPWHFCYTCEATFRARQYTYKEE